MDSSQQALEEIKRHFDFLLQNSNFGLDKFNFDEVHFGNIEAVLKSKENNNNCRYATKKVALPAR